MTARAWSAIRSLLQLVPAFLSFCAQWSEGNFAGALQELRFLKARQRPDGKGQLAPCETWDNATLFCETLDPASGERFPMTLKTQRIAPGEKDTWYLEILGTRAAARFSTR